jgi:hypothetical protein
MRTECSPDLFGFAPVEGRAVVAGFDGGSITSDAGALLLGATDHVIRLTQRAARRSSCSRASRRRPCDSRSGAQPDEGQPAHEIVTVYGCAAAYPGGRSWPMIRLWSSSLQP